MKLFSDLSLKNTSILSDFEKTKLLLIRLFCLSTPPLLLIITVVHFSLSNSKTALLSVLLFLVSLGSLIALLLKRYKAAMFVFLTIPIIAQIIILIFREDLVQPYHPEIAFYVILVVGFLTLIMSAMLNMRKTYHSFYAGFTMVIATAALVILSSEETLGELLTFYIMDIVLTAFSFYLVIINKKVNELIWQKNRMLDEKNDLDASITHEIRNLMTGMMGMNELLKHTNLDDKQKKYMSILDEGTASVLKIISDLHEFSKFQVKGLSINRQKFDLNIFLEMISTTLRNQVEKKGLRFNVDFPENLGHITTDQLRLQQVILNLAGNSIKFTKSGSVSISVNRLKSFYHFTIRDTGIGMSQEKLTHIFEKYNQLNNDMPYNYGGSGLGMFISKNLVETLGGTISVESKPDKGTIYLFSVPVE